MTSFNRSLAGIAAVRWLVGTAGPRRVEAGGRATWILSDGGDLQSKPPPVGEAAGAASEALAYLFPADAERFRKLAMEGARSRVTGGAEYPSDAEAGLDLGHQAAARAIELAKQDGSDRKWAGTVPSGADAER